VEASTDNLLGFSTISFVAPAPSAPGAAPELLDVSALPSPFAFLFGGGSPPPPAAPCACEPGELG
jgi:hypothetical protein